MNIGGRLGVETAVHTDLHSPLIGEIINCDYRFGVYTVLKPEDVQLQNVELALWIGEIY